MKLVVVSTFYNAEKFILQCIHSIQNQSLKDFVVYLVDDCSTDSSYEKAKMAVKDDHRFIIIKKASRQYRLKNFVDVIRNNKDIQDDDVIVEIDGDDLLSHNQVLEKFYHVYLDQNVWICNSRYQDHMGNPGEFGRTDLNQPRKKPWSFGSLRTYRAFLFRNIEDQHLKMDGKYITLMTDVASGLPMLEMAGEEHYRFFDEVMYIYHVHENNSRNRPDPTGEVVAVINRTKVYLYIVLPPYEKLVLRDIKN